MKKKKPVPTKKRKRSQLAMVAERFIVELDRMTPADSVRFLYGLTLVQAARHCVDIRIACKDVASRVDPESFEP